VSVTTIRADRGEGREYAKALRALRPSKRYGGRRAGSPGSGVYVLMGRSIGIVGVTGMGPKPLPAVVRRLRLAQP
jgi:hypothetical protein